MSIKEKCLLLPITTHHKFGNFAKVAEGDLELQIHQDLLPWSWEYKYVCNNKHGYAIPDKFLANGYILECKDTHNCSSIVELVVWYAQRNGRVYYFSTLSRL